MDDNFGDLDLRDYIKLNLRSIELFGYFCPDIKDTFLKVLYYIYAVSFVSFIFIAFMTSELINMVVVFGDIEKMTEGSFLLLTHIVQAWKLHVFVIHQSKVRKLISSLNREEFKPKNKAQHQSLMEDIKVSKIMTKVYMYMCVATCVAWGFFPLLDKNSDNTIRLPLGGWFPFDTTKSPAFECVYIYLTIGSMLNGLGNVSMDTFVSGIIMVVSGQLKLLRNEFEYSEFDFKGNSAAKLAEENLIKKVIHHKNIIGLAADLTELFTTCIMAQFVVSVIIICVTMFQMSLVPIFSLQFLSMSFYQGCLLIQIFLWCYFGNEVILQSDKLTNSAFSMEWVDSSRRLKQNLLFLMTRTQIPLKLYAGGYFTLSLDTFVTIIKSSWSYFVVLNRVHSEE